MTKFRTISVVFAPDELERFERHLEHLARGMPSERIKRSPIVRRAIAQYLDAFERAASTPSSKKQKVA